jgi:hypothetical protein
VQKTTSKITKAATKQSNNVEMDDLEDSSEKQDRVSSLLNLCVNFLAKNDFFASVTSLQSLPVTLANQLFDEFIKHYTVSKAHAKPTITLVLLC